MTSSLTFLFHCIYENPNGYSFQCTLVYKYDHISDSWVWRSHQRDSNLATYGGMEMRNTLPQIFIKSFENKISFHNQNCMDCHSSELVSIVIAAEQIFE